MNKGNVLNVKEDFDKFYKEYRDFISKMDPDNLDIEKIKDMYNQAKGFSDYFNKSGNSVGDDAKERIPLMLENLEDWKNEAEARGTHKAEEGASTDPEAGASTAPVVGTSAPLMAEITSAPAPMESGGQPSLKKVEDPGLRYVNAAIAAAETGLVDEEGQPRKDSFENPLDTREQFPKDFVRGSNYTVGGKSSADLQESEDKKEDVKKIVKDFLGIVENEPENSEKSKQYRFIINAGQDLISMFTDDVKNNIQYQGADLGPVGTPPFEMKWSREGEEVILELQCNFRVLAKGEVMSAELMALNQSGEVELFELGEAPADSPPLVKYNYKARLVPTENGAKLETISYSVELHPGLSHSQKFTVPAPNVFTEMQNAIHSFNNEFTGSDSARTLGDQIQRLKGAIKAVKDSTHYKFAKDSNGGKKEEKKAISMIDRLDKILQASERSKVPIAASIIQKAILFQVNRMKNSDEFNNGMVSLTEKAKPGRSDQFSEESMDEVVGKGHLRLVGDFIERVDRLQDPKSGASKVELGEFQRQLYSFKSDFSQLNKRIKNEKSDIPVHELMNKFEEVTNKLSSQLSGFGIDHCLSVLSVNGTKFSNDKAGRDIIRAHIDMIKISPEYIKYQQAKQNGTEEDHPRHGSFAAVDKCEKLLEKAMSTQKIPLVSDMNNNKLRKFFEENASKIQPQEAPSNRASTSK